MSSSAIFSSIRRRSRMWSSCWMEGKSLLRIWITRRIFSSHRLWKISHWRADTEWKWQLIESTGLNLQSSVRAVAILPGGGKLWNWKHFLKKKRNLIMMVCWLKEENTWFFYKWHKISSIIYRIPLHSHGWSNLPVLPVELPAAHFLCSVCSRSVLQLECSTTVMQSQGEEPFPECRVSSVVFKRNKKNRNI